MREKRVQSLFQFVQEQSKFHISDQIRTEKQNITSTREQFGSASLTICFCNIHISLLTLSLMDKFCPFLFTLFLVKFYLLSQLL